MKNDPNKLNLGNGLLGRAKNAMNKRMKRMRELAGLPPLGDVEEKIKPKTKPKPKKEKY